MVENTKRDCFALLDYFEHEFMSALKLEQHLSSQGYHALVEEWLSTIRMFKDGLTVDDIREYFYMKMKDGDDE